MSSSPPNNLADSFYVESPKTEATTSEKASITATGSSEHPADIDATRLYGTYKRTATPDCDDEAMMDLMTKSEGDLVRIERKRSQPDSAAKVNTEQRQDSEKGLIQIDQKGSVPDSAGDRNSEQPDSEASSSDTIQPAKDLGEKPNYDETEYPAASINDSDVFSPNNIIAAIRTFLSTNPKFAFYLPLYIGCTAFTMRYSPRWVDCFVMSYPLGVILHPGICKVAGWCGVSETWRNGLKEFRVFGFELPMDLESFGVGFYVDLAVTAALLKVSPVMGALGVVGLATGCRMWKQRKEMRAVGKHAWDA